MTSSRLRASVVLGWALALGIAPSPAQAVGVWTEHPENPFVLSNPAVAVDGETGTLYSFGGYPLSSALYRQDLALPHIEWVLESPGGGPSQRSEAHAHFDARRRRLLILGGQTGSPDTNDSWSYDPVSHTWSNLVPHSLGAPRVRSNCPLAYDARGDRLLYVEARGRVTPARLWALSLATTDTTWVLVPTTGAPAVMAGAAGACDSTSNRLFVFGGFDGLYFESTTLWQVDLETGQWSTLLGSGPVGAMLPPWLAVDPVRRSIVACGFMTMPGSTTEVRAAEVPLDSAPRWNTRGVTAEPVDAGHLHWTYDARGRRFVGSHTASGNPRQAELSTVQYHWTTRWRKGRPLAFQGAAGAIDPTGRSWYVHGGRSNESEDCMGAPRPCVSSRLHRISLDDPSSYQVLSPSGTGPGALHGHAAVFDPVEHRVLFHGGLDENGAPRSETWALDVSGSPHWSQVSTQGFAPERSTHGLALDSARRFLYVVGGTGTTTFGIWRLDLTTTPATWSQIASLDPFSYVPSAAGFDSLANRLLVTTAQAGYTVNLGVEPPLVSSPIPMPSQAEGGGFAFDVTGRRMLVHNGSENDSLLGFDGASFSVVTPNTGSSPETIGLSGYDPLTGWLWSLNGQVQTYVHLGGNYYLSSYRPALGLWGVELVQVPRVVELIDASRDSTSVRLAFHSSAPSGAVGVERWTVDLPLWSHLGYANLDASYEYSFLDPSPPAADDKVSYRGFWIDGGGIHYTSVASPTPTRLDLVEAAPVDGGVRIRFAGAGSNGSVLVDRRELPVADWIEVGAAVEATPGMWEFVDASTRAGATYVYRGRFDDGSGERATAESAPVMIPAGPLRTLALRAREGTVGRGWPVAFECRLSAPGPAHLELMDVKGRIVAERIVSGAADAPLVVSIAPERAGAGLYFVRLRQRDEVVVLRVVRL